MRKPTKALVALLLCGAASVDADVVRTRGGGSGGAASAVTPGATTVTGCQNRVMFGDNSELLNCDADLTFTGGNLLTADRATITTGPFLVATGSATAPSIARSTDADDGILLGEVSYFVRDGVESVGGSVSGSTSSLNLCTSGAAGCATQETLSATTAGLRYNDLILTSATMTAETTGRLATGVSSYTWTNAQVVALGATTTGDITVATLPAKTQVLDALVVITGAGAGTTTLTVSCGDAIAGSPFINYVVASNAQAAANTVYGDALAERGTSIDTEFWYLPSYTATTLVTCHFISTGANLSSVTGSTGRVILTTRLLP